MCGVAGVFGKIGEEIEAKNTASRMAYQLSHRGPDDAAYYLDRDIVLVHTRLSIIDLYTGQQPIHNENKTIWTIFNGEIFNYIELRKLLISLGHSFYTKSDTEVIVHLYEEYGEDFVNYLNGQFAICLWDTNTKKFILARDRLGILPLFYSYKGDQLWFASEVKSIISGTQSVPSLNFEALNQIFSFWTPLSPVTIFEEINEVSPGCILVCESDKIIEKRYWDIDFPNDNQFSGMDETEAIESVRELIIDACNIRMRADVPVAAYLSGGLDSTILSAVIRKNSNSDLRTFSITFDDPQYDEESYQNKVIKQLGVSHTSIRCTDEQIAKNFYSTIWSTETPITRTAPIPMGMLSKLVHDSGIKVVITGEGADEVFCGYDLFKETKIRQFWAKNPRSSWRPALIKKLYPYLKLPRSNVSKYLENFFGVGVQDYLSPDFSHLPRIQGTEKIKLFLNNPVNKKKYESQSSLKSILPEQAGSWDLLNKAQYLEIKTLMSGYLLCSQGDRMLMQHSIEGRFPYLDHRLIELANKLHPRLKMRVLNEKYILKRAMQEYVPTEIINRYKQPYRAPLIAPKLLSRQSKGLGELMSEEVIREYGYFNPSKVSFLVKKIQRGQSVSNADNMSFVSILSTQCWHDMFVRKFAENFLKNRELNIRRVN